LKQPITGSFELIKNLNTACILNSIREKELISRAEIARQTGLTPATVTNITSELLELGLIFEKSHGASSGGRKPVLLKINVEKCFFGGLHISSRFIETAVTDIEVNIIYSEKRQFKKDIHSKEAMQIAIEMLEKAQNNAPQKKLTGIGVCVHGLVHSDEGVLIFAPNLGWENVHIVDVLHTKFKIPIFVENDVQAMTLAENGCGLAKNISDFVYLYIGSGIGGGIMLHNELYKGYGGFAGEFGHTTIMPDGPECTCGNKGCLQSLASESAVIANYSKAKNLDESIDFDEILKEVKNNDTIAICEINKCARYIGIEVGNIINMFSPSLIVINGNITSLGNYLLSIINDEVKARALQHSSNHTRIVFSQLGTSAPLKGAATLVIKTLFEYPKRFL
jgi:predicted NBD/HSP70 family sugar kinase